jgi:glycosyltransferase involved in cell wall biosynthesis
MRVILEMEKTTRLRTGLGMFCFHLGKNLIEQSPSDLEFGFYLPENQVNLFGNYPLVFRQNPVHKFFFPASLQPDVWHCCHQDSAYYPRSGSSIVLTVHDLNFMQKYSGWRREYRKKKLGKMLGRASALVCISKQTGLHLEEVYGLGPDDYRVIYNGSSLSHFPGAAKSPFQRERPFLLCIGVMSPRKNAHVLCGMLANLPDYDLILAGPPHSDYRQKIEDEALKFGVSDKVIFAGEVSEEEKYRLYQNMEALVFPSLAEGFGLPVTEAMSLGKPVFLSRFGSLPEIGGVLANYWDNFEAVEMAKVVSIGLKQHHEMGRAEGLKERAALFNWDKTAEEYIRLYRSLA